MEKLDFSVTLDCGGSASENNTYLVQGATTSLSSTPCTYKICPCSTDICRIRYDFTTNVLADQVLGTAVVTADVVTTNSKQNLVYNRPNQVLRGSDNQKPIKA